MYRERITKAAPSYDPRQIEAFMRLQYGTLNHLSPQTFAAEVVMACLCINEDPDAAERLAQSYGL